MNKIREKIMGMAFFGPALVLLTLFLFIPMILRPLSGKANGCLICWRIWQKRRILTRLPICPGHRKLPPKRRSDMRQNAFRLRKTGKAVKAGPVGRFPENLGKIPQKSLRKTSLQRLFLQIFGLFFR